MRCFDIGRAAHASSAMLCRKAKVWLSGAVRSHHSEGRWALWAAQGLVCTIHEARPSDYCDFRCHGAAQTAFRPGCFVTAGAADTPEHGNAPSPDLGAEQAVSHQRACSRTRFELWRGSARLRQSAILDAEAGESRPTEKTDRARLSVSQQRSPAHISDRIFVLDQEQAKSAILRSEHPSVAPHTII